MLNITYGRDQLEHNMKVCNMQNIQESRKEPEHNRNVRNIKGLQDTAKPNRQISQDFPFTPTEFDCLIVTKTFCQVLLLFNISPIYSISNLQHDTWQFVNNDRVTCMKVPLKTIKSNQSSVFSPASPAPQQVQSSHQCHCCPKHHDGFQEADEAQDKRLHPSLA